MKTVLNQKNRINKTDVFALVLAAAVFGYLFYAAPAGMGSIDESEYYAIVQRQLLGDRLLIDIWHVSQISSVLEILPYWFFVTLTGSSQGVILFLRYLYVAVDLILFWFLYGRLRRYGAWGLLSAVLFCTYVPSAIKILNYYTMALHGLIVVCALLAFGKEKKSAPVLLFTGVVFACTVLAEPFIAAVYFLWCVLVLGRALAKKKDKSFLDGYAFVADGRIWLFVSLGILLTAVVFFSYLLIRSPLPEIIKELPEFFTDHEYAVSKGAGSSLIEPDKLKDVLRFYGYLPAAGFVLAGLAALLRRLHKLQRWKGLLFAAVCLCLAGSYACAAYLLATSGDFLTGTNLHAPAIVFYLYFQGVPLSFFGLACYVLCEKKDRRIFLFWLVGFFAGVMVDLSSELVMGVCAAVTFPAAVISLRDLLWELVGERKDREKNREASAVKPKRSVRLPVAVAALSITALLLWEGFGLYTLGFYGVVERIADRSGEPISATLTAGPMKGIRTTERVKDVYGNILSDLDVIKTNTEGPVYVAQLFPYAYLYMELPYGTYSAWYVEADSEVRQCRYWELHPERRPTYIYVPYYDSYYYRHYSEIAKDERWGENKLAFLSSICEFERTEGNAGAILRVTRWRD